MAANTFDHSRSLFVIQDEGGSPMKFYMRPCSERKHIRQLIEHGGGVMTNIATADCIRLAEKGSIITTTDTYISTRYITECVKENRLVDMTKFSYMPNTMPQEGSADDGMEPAPVIIRVREKLTKGRKKYTQMDDRNIVKYIIENKLHREIRGKKIWEDMAFIGITSHSSQSMRDHMLKVILPNIHSYSFPAHWKSLLTGDTLSHHDEPHDNQGEYSGAESGDYVIDTDSDGSGVTNNASQSKRRKTDENKQKAEVVSPKKWPLQIVAVSTKTSPKKTHLKESIGSGSHTSKIPFLKGNSGLGCKSPKKQLLNKDTGSRKLAKKPISSTSSEETIEEAEKELEEDSVNMPGSSQDKIVAPRQKQRNCEPTQTCRASDDDEHRKEIVVESQDTIDDDVHLDKTLSSQSASDSPERPHDSNRLKGDQDRDCRTEDHNPSESSDHDDVDEFDEALFKMTQEKTLDENGSHSSSRARRRHGNSEQNCNNSETSSPLRKKLKKTNSSANERQSPPRRSKTQSKRLENIQSQRLDSVQVRGRTGLDKRLQSGSNTEKQTQSDSSDEDSLDAECQRQAREGSAMMNTDHREGSSKKRKKTIGRPDEKSSPQLLKGKSAKPVKSQGSSDKEQLEKDCKAIQALAERFNMSFDEAMYCTYVNSGSIADTIHWIKMGVDRGGYPAWTAEDDEILQGEDEEEKGRLAHIFGMERFQARLAFLEKQKW